MIQVSLTKKEIERLTQGLDAIVDNYNKTALVASLSLSITAIINEIPREETLDDMDQIFDEAERQVEKVSSELTALKAKLFNAKG